MTQLEFDIVNKVLDCMGFYVDDDNYVQKNDEFNRLLIKDKGKIKNVKFIKEYGEHVPLGSDEVFLNPIQNAKHAQLLMNELVNDNVEDIDYFNIHHTNNGAFTGSIVSDGRDIVKLEKMDSINSLIIALIIKYFDEDTNFFIIDKLKKVNGDDRINKRSGSSYKGRKEVV